MLVLVVHNSDEVSRVFFGETKEEILQKVFKDHEVCEDIRERLIDEEIIREGEDDNDESLPIEFNLDMVIDNLHHDGDSEDGYTLLTAI
jgi:hypothetical protein